MEERYLAHDDMSDCIEISNRDLNPVENWKKDIMIYCLLCCMFVYRCETEDVSKYTQCMLQYKSPKTSCRRTLISGPSPLATCDLNRKITRYLSVCDVRPTKLISTRLGESVRNSLSTRPKPGCWKACLLSIRYAPLSLCNASRSIHFCEIISSSLPVSQVSLTGRGKASCE